MRQKGFKGKDWGRRPRIRLIEDGKIMRLLVDNRPYMSWSSDDDISARLAIVQLSKLGLGTQEEIAKAFSIHEKSVYNHIQSFSKKGAYGLVPEKSGPKGSWKVNARLRSEILFIALNQGILEYEEIKRQLEERGDNVSIPSIRQVLLENGIIEMISLPDPRVQQAELFCSEDQEQIYLDFGMDRKMSGTATKGKAQGREAKLRDPGVNNTVSEGIVRARKYYSQAQRIYLDQIENGGTRKCLQEAGDKV